jgi:UDP-N-acetylglucosamine--N-acetylmuramyl-(pentapeptide) pyrophosphoryl-undecaprenol N-acetylglucosamine transferase
VCGQILRKSCRECVPQKNPNQFTALIFGGSQGSKQVKQLVFDALTRIDEKVRKDLVCLHVTGSSAKDSALCFYRSQGLKHEVFEYCPNIETLYSRADVVIGRAGAGTMAECAWFRIPFICIPFPSKHQSANASYLEKREAAVVIKGGRKGVYRLRSTLIRLYENVELQKDMAAKLKRAVPVNGIETLSVWVEKAARKEMLHA